MNRLIALDIETYDPNLHELGDGSIRKDGRILCCGAHGDGISKVFDFDNPNDIQELRDILKDPSIDKIYHNGIGYDLPWLYCGYDMVIKGVQHDTMTRAALIDEYQSLGLDDCCRKLGLRGKNKDETIEVWYEKWQTQMKLAAKSFKKYGISDNNEVIIAKENNDFETWKLSPTEVEALITQNYKKDVWANALVIWADPVGREMMKKYNLQDCIATFNLFKAQEKLIEPLHNVYEMECNFENITGKRIGVKLRKGLKEETVFYYDLEENKLVLDRSNSGESFATEYGTERKCPYEGSNLKLQVFVDTSSIEVFVNDGEEVFTARIFTAKDSSNISIFANGKTDVNLKIWDLSLNEK